MYRDWRILAVCGGALALAACGPTPTARPDAGDEGVIELRTDCGDVPEVGQCRNDVAIFCDRRSASVVEKRCGARGLSCEEDTDGARCVDESGEEQEVEFEGMSGEPCPEDLDTRGICVDDGAGGVLRYCAPIDRVVVEVACIRQSSCGYNAVTDWYTCLPNGCGEVTMTDRCDDAQTLVSCERNASDDGWEAQTISCGAGSFCELDNYGNGECKAAESGPAVGCDELGAVGACLDADTVRWCIDEEEGIQQYDCSAPQVCGFNEELSLYACVDPA